jgi:hypothetical protein
MIKSFSDWYDGLKEPYRLLMAMFICHPILIINMFPLYGSIGMILILPFIIYRIWKGN